MWVYVIPDGVEAPVGTSAAEHAPGCYSAAPLLDIGSLSSDQRLSTTIPLYVVMRLHSPTDNSLLHTRDVTSLPAISSPVHADWDAVPYATSYRIVVWTANQAGEALDNVLDLETASTEAVFTLDRSNPDDSSEFYRMGISAWRGSRWIGEVHVMGEDFWAPNVSFEVE